MRLPLLLVACSLAGCPKADPPPPEPAAVQQVQATVVFEVVDEAGQLLPEADIIVDGRGPSLFLEDGRGSLSDLDGAPLVPGQELYYTAWVSGFHQRRDSHVVEPGEGLVRITLEREMIEVLDHPELEWDGPEE